jgi:DNA-binding GntR family transcriptional regulator
MLHSMLDTVRLQTRHLAGGLQSPHQVSWEEHAAIVDAVIGGRAREATTLMRRHLNDRHAAGIVARSPTAPA